MVALLIQFSYLQLLDILTTLAFLAHGVQEGNPLVRILIGETGSPLAGLVAAKAFALILAVCLEPGGADGTRSRVVAASATIARQFRYTLNAAFASASTS